jgi:hypothetical protein
MRKYSWIIALLAIFALAFVGFVSCGGEPGPLPPTDCDTCGNSGADCICSTSEPSPWDDISFVPCGLFVSSKSYELTFTVTLPQTNVQVNSQDADDHAMIRAAPAGSFLVLSYSAVRSSDVGRIGHGSVGQNHNLPNGSTLSADGNGLFNVIVPIADLIRVMDCQLFYESEPTGNGVNAQGDRFYILIRPDTTLESATIHVPENPPCPDCDRFRCICNICEDCEEEVCECEILWSLADWLKGSPALLGGRGILSSSASLHPPIRINSGTFANNFAIVEGNSLRAFFGHTSQGLSISIGEHTNALNFDTANNNYRIRIVGTAVGFGPPPTGSNIDNFNNASHADFGVGDLQPVTDSLPVGATIEVRYAGALDVGIGSANLASGSFNIAADLPVTVATFPGANTTDVIRIRGNTAACGVNGSGNGTTVIITEIKIIDKGPR